MTHSLADSSIDHPQTALDAFVAQARAAIAGGTFEAIVLSANRDARGEPKGVRARAIALRGVPALS